ncbi:peptidoglycan-binding protein [Streptomyces sp. NPDC088350]|uniref:peptidoglycan-binding domain-containing protein n=1 Tax=Streptomyces sp. NPDC088350 TaxID=3365854 RepID=UPI0037FA030D
MNEAKGHICPQCGAPRAADGSPSCGCTQRASDALRDARTAEAAAAEDFDPLRIRPYVELDGNPQEQPALGVSAAPEADAGETVRLSAVEETMPLRAVTPPPAAPNTADLSLFETGGNLPEAPTHPDPPRRHRRTVLLAVAGAVVAVTAAAGFASGLFSYETPSRDEAAPQDVRASVPTVSRSAAPVSPSRSGSTSVEPTSASPTPSLSTSPSPSTSPTPSVTPSKSANAGPTPTPTASASTAAAGRQGAGSPAPVLQRGDEGPEVTELQLRLAQLNLYTGPHNGVFDKQVQASVRTYQLARGIQSDELGVYGAATRARLESETTEP